MVGTALLVAATVLMIGIPYRSKLSNRDPLITYTNPHQNIGDYYFYLSVINQGKIQDTETPPYTTEPSTATRFFHVYYLLLGKLSVVLNTDVIHAYYIGILLPYILFCLFVVLLVRSIFRYPYTLVALFIIFMTGPFPPVTLTLFGYRIPLGLAWWTKMDTYTRLTHTPHHYFAIALLVGAVWGYNRFVDSRRIRFAIFAAVLIATSMRVFTVPVFVFTLALSAVLTIDLVRRTDLFRHRNLITGNLIVLGSALVSGTFMYATMQALGFPWNVGLEWEFNFSRVPHPETLIQYVSNLGVLPFFVVLSIPVAWKRRNFRYRLFLAITILPLLLWYLSVNGYIPISMIRFVYTAPYVFAGLLATAVIQHAVTTIRPTIAKTALISVFTVVVVGNAISTNVAYWGDALEPYPYYTNTYLPVSYLSAMKYLDRHAPVQRHVMSDEIMGSVLPAFSHSVAFIGHEICTVNFPDKFATMRLFFHGNLGRSLAKRLFQEHAIDYVFWDTCTSPDTSRNYGNLLERLYRNDCVIIFRTNRDAT